jgi:hypothetical protein
VTKSIDINWGNLDKWERFRNEAILNGVYVGLVTEDNGELATRMHTGVLFHNHELSFRPVHFTCTSDGDAFGVALYSGLNDITPDIIIPFEKPETMTVGFNVQVDGHLYIGEEAWKTKAQDRQEYQC